MNLKLTALFVLLATPVFPLSQQPATSPYQPVVHLTAEGDHQRLLDLLGLTTLRPGRENNPASPLAANYDESKANPFPQLPDPLLLPNGKRVATPALWWTERRPEIVELFDREIYGRVPASTPRVTWSVTPHRTHHRRRHRRSLERPHRPRR